jgi:hypothetical protein
MTYILYGLDDRGSGVRFPAGAGNFSLHHRVQNGSGAHPASYPMGTRGSFHGVERPGREADHFHLVSRPRMRGTVTPPPEYASMAWCSVKAQGQLYLSPSVLISIIQTRRWCLQFFSIRTDFLIFLVAFWSKAEKAVAVKNYPYFRPFWVGHS